MVHLCFHLQEAVGFLTTLFKEDRMYSKNISKSCNAKSPDKAFSLFKKKKVFRL